MTKFCYLRFGFAVWQWKCWKLPNYWYCRTVI